jgi:hypothetical protein
MMKKLAVIRGKNIAECPYGLNAIEACKSVGNAITTMQALAMVDESRVDDVKNKNKIIYLTNKDKARCPFANNILTTFDKVDCSYGDNGQGQGITHFPASPLYARNFVGTGFDITPDNRQQNNTDPRNFQYATDQGVDVPFGLFSIFSNVSNEIKLLKIASKPTNKIANIGDKLVILRDKYFDVLKLAMLDRRAIELNEEQIEKLLFVIDDWVK